MNNDSERAPSGQALVASDGAQEVSTLAGFDPSRWQWESGACVDRLGRVSSYDIHHTQELDSGGVMVVASCYEGRDVAAFIAAAPAMFKALQLIVDMEPTHANAEAKWMAGVARAAIASAIEARRAATPQSDAVHESAASEAGDAPTVEVRP